MTDKPYSEISDEARDQVDKLFDWGFVELFTLSISA